MITLPIVLAFLRAAPTLKLNAARGPYQNYFACPEPNFRVFAPYEAESRVTDSERTVPALVATYRLEGTAETSGGSVKLMHQVLSDSEIGHTCRYARAAFEGAGAERRYPEVFQ